MEKKIYYCAMKEIYIDGSVKTGIRNRVCKELPKNQVSETPIMTVYYDWFSNLELAEAHLAERQAA